MFDQLVGPVSGVSGTAPVGGAAGVKTQTSVASPGDDFGSFEELGWRLQFAFDPNDSFSGLLKLHGFKREEVTLEEAFLRLTKGEVS